MYTDYISLVILVLEDGTDLQKDSETKLYSITYGHQNYVWDVVYILIDITLPGITAFVKI